MGAKERARSRLYRIGGPIFGGAYTWRGLFSECYGIPHTRLQNFHMTLGTVNQSFFPVQSAVEEINRVIPPGKWHKTPVILRQPVCHRCERLMKPV